ncbi:MAG: hypothetical protein RLZZ38_734 [Bacteroidota bacterium]|jgi:hypothetical protein
MRTDLNQVTPPFIAHGTLEQNIEEGFNYSIYDPETQKTIFPYGMGSQKRATKSAKNAGNIIFPKWKNVTDDAQEK